MGDNCRNRRSVFGNWLVDNGIKRKDFARVMSKNRSERRQVPAAHVEAWAIGRKVPGGLTRWEIADLTGDEAMKLESSYMIGMEPKNA